MEKRLHRNSQDTVVGGVAAGLANYFAIDPLLIRILFIVSLFFSFGTSILIYIILWVVLPDINYSAPPVADTVSPAPPAADEPASKSDKNIKVAGIALLAIGAFMLFDDWIVWYDFHKYFWPLAFIGLGAFLLLRRRDEQEFPAAGGSGEPTAPLNNPPAGTGGSTTGPDDDYVIKVN